MSHSCVRCYTCSVPQARQDGSCRESGYDSCLVCTACSENRTNECNTTAVSPRGYRRWSKGPGFRRRSITRRPMLKWRSRGTDRRERADSCRDQGRTGGEPSDVARVGIGVGSQCVRDFSRLSSSTSCDGTEFSRYRRFGEGFGHR